MGMRLPDLMTLGCERSWIMRLLPTIDQIFQSLRILFRARLALFLRTSKIIHALLRMSSRIFFSRRRTCDRLHPVVSDTLPWRFSYSSLRVGKGLSKMLSDLVPGLVYVPIS